MWMEGIFVIAVVVLLAYFLLPKEQDKHLGVYSRPGRWFYFKKYVFLVLLFLRKRRARQSGSTSTSKSIQQDAGHGVASYDTPEEMEQPQPIEDHPHSMDSVFLGGFAVDGTTLVLRIGRRHQRKAEFWVIINIPGVGLLQSTLYPSTVVHNTDGSTFTANGLTMDCLEPMNKWRVSFNGQLRTTTENEWKKAKYHGQELHVEFSFIWKAFTPHFDFDTDMDPGMLADAIARETWTRKFWEILRSGHQTHYEQWGDLKGSLQIQGQKDRTLHLRAMRDHSYGMRDWTKFHRYITHLIYLEDGTVCHVTGVCMPDTLSFLRCGYICLPDGAPQALEDSSLDISSIGENKNLPDQHFFTISAGGKCYLIKAACHATVKWFNMEDQATETYERLMHYTCNGIKGSGIAEFTYRRSIT